MRTRKLVGAGSLVRRCASNGDLTSKVYNGVKCIGSSNSNRFTPFAVGSTGFGTEYTVVGNKTRASRVLGSR